ncbi:tRNA (adenosine(37)-N6)-dimethylallyltransferase MiaA [Mesobaculum littorinae]|nr:tRNA (adenosine(37)-N6)-dimethylallyltransferase MiaA [Mesobaculum littorinae]
MATETLTADAVLARTADPAPVLIAGPTASGKSALALRIAERHGGVIVNADALQVFSDWRLLTARPSAADEAALPHALYGHVPGDTPYSVGRWLADLDPHLAHPRPIIVGGTGLYFAALTEGLAEIPPIPASVRETATRRIAEEGHAALLNELDRATAARIDHANPARVQRAWEVLTATGRPLADWQAQTGPARLPRGAAHAFVVQTDREALLSRISRRFDLMLDAGLLEEARSNLPNYSQDRPSSKAIGATELLAHLQGAMTLDEARERIVIATRQYAKRQRTWFRARMGTWNSVTL